MMLGLSAIRRLEAHVKRQETRQAIKQAVETIFGGVLFVVFVFGAIALTAEPKLPGASEEVENAFKRGYAKAMAEPRKINPIDWSDCK